MTRTRFFPAKLARTLREPREPVEVLVGKSGLLVSSNGLERLVSVFGVFIFLLGISFLTPPAPRRVELALCSP